MHKASRLVLLTMLLLARPTQAQSRAKTDVVDRGKRATALVEVTSPRGESSGSAFCIDKAGLFVTNAHVVEDATRVRLVVDIGLKTQRRLQAKVLRSDDGFDLALLKVDADLGLIPLELGEDNTLALTDPVTAFGFPFGQMTSLAAGAAPDITVIRSRVTSLRMVNGKLQFVQFDGQLNPGNSGGPVLDDEARVVGVAVATIRGAAINLAVPVRLLSEFLAAPGLVFEPPPLEYRDRSRPVMWTIKVQPPTPTARLPEGLSVVVKLATGPDEVRMLTAQPVGGGVFKVKVTPVPRDPDRKIELEVRSPSGGTVRVLVKDGDVRVGGKRFMLSDLRVLYGGKSPRAYTSRGQVVVGPIAGLGKVKTKAARKTLTIDLNRATQIDVRPLDPPPPVQAVEALVEARQGSRVLATVHKRASLSGAPADRLMLKPGEREIVRIPPVPAAPVAPPPAPPAPPAPSVVAETPLPEGSVGEIRRFNGSSWWVSRIAFSPDGRRLLAAGSPVTIWDVKTGRPSLIFNGHDAWPAVFSPDGKRAVAACRDQTVRVWDAESGRELRRIGPFQGALCWALAISPDAHQILFSVDNTLYHYDLDTGLELRRFTGKGTRDGIRSAAFSPDGRTIAYSVGGGNRVPICLWDLTDGKELRRLVSEGECTQVAFSADGRRILSGHSGGWVRLRDVSNGEEVLSIQTFQGLLVEGVALSPDGRRILSAGTDGSVRLWDVANGQEIFRFEGHTNYSLGVAFAPDGRLAASGGTDGTVRLWRLPDPPRSEPAAGGRRPPPAPSSLPAEATKAEALPTSAPPRPSGPKAFAEPIGIKIVPIPSGSSG